ncbi:MAG: S-methyl-5'-thioinosine phosphorylase [Gammaproteobacteria bacterium]
MTAIAIIGGTGLTRLEGLEITHREVVSTPYGEPSAPLTHGKFAGCEAVFFSRHGQGHRIPPHRINYRANLWALKSVGVEVVIATTTVGGIRKDLVPGMLVVPDQIVDYTYGRDNSYFNDEQVVHVDFTAPYDPDLRARLLAAGKDADIEVADGGVYAATQGPRLETAAEINRLESDGCDMVGMTGMPEAVLARELELRYAACAAVLNRAAGRGDGDIHGAIKDSMTRGIERVHALLQALFVVSPSGVPHD